MSSEHEIVLECWVIIIVLGIAAYMFVRGHKKIWAGSVLPLMLVPFVNIIYSPINAKIMKHSMESAVSARIIMYIILFAVVCVWVVLWGTKLPVGKTKYIYISVGIGFTLILLLIFVRDLILRPLF